MFVMISPAFAKDVPAPVPKEVDTVPPAPAGARPPAMEQPGPPVLGRNLPPTSACTGKTSRAMGVTAYGWVTVLAVKTRHPALIVASAALSIYFISEIYIFLSDFLVYKKSDKKIQRLQ